MRFDRHKRGACSEMQEVCRWVKQVGPYYFFVTVSVRHERTSRGELEKALNLALNKINRMAFGRLARHGKRSLSSFSVIESGGQTRRIHAHILLGKPPGFFAESMKEIVGKVLRSIYSFGQFDIRRYRAERHLSYVLKEGAEAIFPAGCRPSK